jgi:hypothetical protein
VSIPTLARTKRLTIDPAHRLSLIYVSQQYADGAAPVVDVFKVR